ncbi:MAG: pyridoxal phosphate-dependent aminotransferase [Candidatus Roseilinea sp.]|uniref:pyridoxal phosphate-dependent aminotransferase n=1 Tax=Candidatus Roseilinea sp. TaxID=2838777 RepID=UPI00404B484C
MTTTLNMSALASSPLPPARPELSELPFSHHGALDFAELEQTGLSASKVLDFSVNSNPFGPSPRAVEAFRAIALEQYPDRACLALRRKLAERHGTSIEHLLVGNGAAELIWLVSLAYLNPQRTALIVGPTFGEYERAARLMGARVEIWHAAPEDNFQVRVDAVERAISACRPQVVFWCNPNNPTGAYVPDEEIVACAARHSETLFVIDQAYRRFVFEPANAAAWDERQTCALPANLLALRSMTKDYALAGLRLGYALGHQAVIDALARTQPPWSVNAAAQAAGCAALDDEEHISRSLRQLAAAREDLIKALEQAKLQVWPSATHFFLVEVGDGARFRRALLQAGLQVRDCASFGLPSCVRIATRRPHENAHLLRAIRALSEWR